MYRTVFCIACLLSVPGTARSQWPARPIPDLPLSGDGKANLTAPAPRTSGGTPDLSGLWIPEPTRKENLKAWNTSCFHAI